MLKAGEWRKAAGPPGQTFGVGALARAVLLAVAGNATEDELKAAKDAAYRDGWNHAETTHAMFEGRMRAQRDALVALVARVEAIQ